MKKFLAWLEAHGACPERVRHFAFFPTLELAAQAATVNDLDWLTQQEPFTAAREIFEAAERPAREIYDAAVRQAREMIYDAAALMQQEPATATAEIFDDAARPARQMYDDAVRHAGWMIYDAAVRQAR